MSLSVLSSCVFLWSACPYSRSFFRSLFFGVPAPNAPRAFWPKIATKNGPKSRPKMRPKSDQKLHQNPTQNWTKIRSKNGQESDSKMIRNPIPFLVQIPDQFLAENRVQKILKPAAGFPWISDFQLKLLTNRLPAARQNRGSCGARWWTSSKNGPGSRCISEPDSCSFSDPILANFWVGNRLKTKSDFWQISWLASFTKGPPPPLNFGAPSLFPQ